MNRSTFVLRQVRKATPFGFPLMVARLREKLTSEKLADRVQRMQVEFDEASLAPAQAGAQLDLPP